MSGEVKRGIRWHVKQINALGGDLEWRRDSLGFCATHTIVENQRVEFVAYYNEALGYLEDRLLCLEDCNNNLEVKDEQADKSE